MELQNRTPLAADLLSTVFGEDRMLAAVIARGTWRIEGKHLVPTPDAPWPIDASPMTTSAGEFPGDMPFLTGGIDFIVAGHAVAPGPGEVRRLRVEARIGDRFEHAIDVIGDRIWERSPGGLRPSPPEPFTRMSLGFENAFGGEATLPQGKLPYPSNPAGKGYYPLEELALNQPLPNLENPEHRITRFDDTPEPAGLGPYPFEGALRVMNAVDTDLSDPRNPQAERIKPLLFNHAHPKMILAPDNAPEPGEEVSITGVQKGSEPLRFQLPDLSLHAHVQLEDRHFLFPLHLDQIGVLTDARRVFLSYRVVFRYRIRPLERRRTTLYEGPLPESTPEAYVNAWEE